MYITQTTAPAAERNAAFAEVARLVKGALKL
ncbi:hypothetical protein BH20VER2_BH20VER2_10450 [soil metagenome]